MNEPQRTRSYPGWRQWTPVGRAIVFVLSAASIWCLLAEFYGLCSMRTFTLRIFIPATALLLIMAIMDRLRGDGRLFRAVAIGTIGGLIAAAAYDIFRLPYVFADRLGIEAVIPHLPLYKVFPAFGAMILGEEPLQSKYSLAAHLIGWTYHFSNGATFGIMYAALIGDGTRRHWTWAVLLAVGIELALLYTPYASYFAIPVGSAFIVATLLAHILFGIVLGLHTRWHSRRWCGTSC
jgi:hypothetical protein